MGKRKRERSKERLERKIRKYERRLNRQRQSATPPSMPPFSPTPRCPTPEEFAEVCEIEIPASPIMAQDQEVQFIANDVAAADAAVVQDEPTKTDEERKDEDEQLDEDVLALLGDAPQETKFGPPIHKDLATRWADIIKKGLEKDKKKEIKDKYLPPENCKTIDAPKLNLEAQAAVADVAVKRDKAMAAKQTQIGCALTALGMALGRLCKNKNKENLPIINIISDASRLLCDHQHQESTTRRNFVLAGLEQTTRDSVKDTEIDTWLFGESFQEKLKASKAIKKSGQEISMINKNKKTPAFKPHLNFRGPTGSQQKSRATRFGPPTNFQHSKKPLPPSRNQTLVQNKPPQRSYNNRR